MATVGRFLCLVGINGNYVYDYILTTSCIKTHKTSGTVNGAGYDCRNGQVRKFEETDEGIWNMVGFDSKLWKWRFFKLLKWRLFISVLPCAVASEH